MLKGHLQIDLHNEITGEDKRIEQDNMVTNALGYLLGLAANAGGKGTNMFDDLLPAATKALGGLFLFDGTLTEDVNNVHFPMSVHLTGHAGQSANTASKLGGSINTAESGRTDTGYVNVWDFSTSQANGTIASLALIPREEKTHSQELNTAREVIVPIDTTVLLPSMKAQETCTYILKERFIRSGSIQIL